MKVGLCLPQTAPDGGAAWSEIRTLALLAESAGVDSLWLADHFLHRTPDADTGLHEAFGLLTAVASITSTVELGPLVACLSFRPVGLLAKIAATLDEVSEGRLVLGVGCGWHEPEYRAFGYPFDHRVGRFEEAVVALRALLDGERVTTHGRWTTLDDAVLLPSPDRRIPLLVAADGPRMLRLTASHGDAWQAAWFGAPDASFREQRARLADACAAEDRDAEPAIYAGLEVADISDDPHVRRDAAAIEDALGAWAVEGVAHVQLGVWPASVTAWEPVLDGIRRFREGRVAP